jgi:flavin reductase
VTLMHSSGEVADQKFLRSAMGTFATGVTVVTVGGDDPHGMTANSFTSVSLDPALVLVCVGRNAHMHDKLLADGTVFGVSVLAHHQEPVARHFANNWRELGAAEFENVDWLPGRLTEVPLVKDAMAAFECQVWRSYDGGDHSIFLGELLSVDWRRDEEGLLFAGGKFRRFAPHQEVVTP